VATLLVFYLLVVRLTRCRVETMQHRPCRWRVRGLLGTCDFHVGYKRSLPVLVRGDDFLGLPTFMWPRDFAGAPNHADPQPTTAHGMAATTTKAQRPLYDQIMIGATVAGLFVATAAFVRDLIAG
jgi:hypothetical protein